VKAVLESTITCPHCGLRTTETMPTDACLFCWACPGCGARLKPKPGACCVFCSYGSVKCPPVQVDDGCCPAQPSVSAGPSKSPDLPAVANKRQVPPPALEKLPLKPPVFSAIDSHCSRWHICCGTR